MIFQSQTVILDVEMAKDGFTAVENWQCLNCWAPGDAGTVQPASGTFGSQIHLKTLVYTYYSNAISFSIVLNVWDINSILFYSSDRCGRVGHKDQSPGTNTQSDPVAASINNHRLLQDTSSACYVTRGYNGCMEYRGRVTECH